MPVTVHGALQIALFCGLMVLLIRQLGVYMARVFNRQWTVLAPVLRPIERLIYRMGGVNPRQEHHWTTYTAAVLLLNFAGLVFLYALARLQHLLPLNPQAIGPVAPDTAFNTAVSFTSNTNWQSYAGESTMNYLVQMAGLTVMATVRPTLAIHPYLWSAAAVGLAAIVGKLLAWGLSLANPSLVFLTAVLVSAVSWGLRPSIVAALLSLLVYNFFFVHPVYTFTVASPQDLLTLMVYLIVAVLTSNLAARVRVQADAATQREARTAALYAFSREIAGAAELDDVLRAIVTQVAHLLRAQVVVLLPEADRLVLKAGAPATLHLTDAEHAAATWAWQHHQPTGCGTETLPGAEWLYLPLGTVQGTVGVLGLQFDTPRVTLSPDQRRLLEALAGQAAVAIERAQLAQEMAQARVLTATERLRDALLSSVSHDLRTPLVSIIGATSSLLTYGASYDEATRRDLLLTVQEEAERLNRFVGNLLDMMRLESGVLKLKQEWVDLPDVIGTAVARLVVPLSRHRLVVEVEPGLPMLRVDFVLLEHVLVNLLENAAKYAPPGTTIRLDARREDDGVVVDVADEGVGVPAADLERIFDKFYRVQRGDRYGAGTGLGLSICRGIIEAHGGHISAKSPANGRGTVLTVRLPLEHKPPPLAEP
jgi:two-component system sensor histidine kinase KdpD